MNVEEIMTTNVISVREDATIEDAARLMTQHRISGLPVVNWAGALVGMLTEYDLIARGGLTVADVMSGSVMSTNADTNIEDITQIFIQQRFRRLPVMRNGQLVGIISRSDLVRQLAMRWVCEICGEVVQSLKAPERCPRCSAPATAFAHEIVPPGV